MLNIEKLNGGYNKFQLADISLNLPKGYVMGLIGENGSGKTTLIKLIMDLIARNSGKITVNGMDNITEGVKVREQIGFVYDQSPYYKNLKVKDMTSIIKRFYPAWNHDKYLRLIKTFNIDELEKIADYITMIKNGKVQFIGSKDDFIDSYSIIKCDPKFIDEQLISGFVGHRTTSVSFEGLTNNDDLISILKYNSIIERPETAKKSL